MSKLLFKAYYRYANFKTENRTVRAIGNGLINIIPFVLVGAFAMVLIGLPIPQLEDALSAITGDWWYRLGDTLGFATIEAIGLAALLSVSHSLALEADSVRKGETSAFIPVLAALSSYIILFVVDLNSGDMTFPRTGGTGILYALITAIVSVKLFFAFERVGRRRRAHRRHALDADLRMRSAFRSVFPLFATLLVVVVVHSLLGYPMRTGAIVMAIDAYAQSWLIGNDIGSVLLTVFSMQLLWLFGVHGSQTILSRFPTVADVGANASTIAIDPSQLAASTPVCATEEFYLNFVSLGGTGATLGMLIVLLLAGAAYRDKRLAKASLVPSLFNINETLVYGIPMIFNPLLAVPFILAPMAVAAICYAAFASGLVPPIIQTTEWTNPIFLSGYYTTGSAWGAVLQGVCLLVSAAIYAPFVMVGRRLDNQVRLRRFEKLKAAAMEAAGDEFLTIVTRDDAVGETAREFVAELHEYFERKSLPFHLVYQPKTDDQGRVFGAEALLRWQHTLHGYISPVVLIEMTDEAKLSAQLGRWVAKTAVAQMAQWKKSGIVALGRPFKLSINLNPRHLGEDPAFPAYLAKLFERHAILPHEIDLEITEHVAMHSTDATTSMFRQLREAGAELSIDDMGMGYSSLTYITDFGVSTVKIDASLVSEIATDETQREIVRSIVALAGQLGLGVIVEGVETEEQVEALRALGCQHFQGYFFSRPLKADEFADYVRSHGFASGD